MTLPGEYLMVSSFQPDKVGPLSRQTYYKKALNSVNTANIITRLQRSTDTNYQIDVILNIDI